MKRKCLFFDFLCLELAATSLVRAHEVVLGVGGVDSFFPPFQLITSKKKSFRTLSEGNYIISAAWWEFKCFWYILAISLVRVVVLFPPPPQKKTFPNL